MITRCVLSDARAEQPLLTLAGIHVGHTNAAVSEYHRHIGATPARDLHGSDARVPANVCESAAVNPI